jgi:hypothetical protein
MIKQQPCFGHVYQNLRAALSGVAKKELLGWSGAHQVLADRLSPAPGYQGSHFFFSTVLFTNMSFHTTQNTDLTTLYIHLKLSS